MQPSQILHAIRRSLVAYLVILLVCIPAGLGVVLSATPVAMATTALGIQPKSKKTPSFSTQAKDLMPTLVEPFTSPKVLEPATANLNMETIDLPDALTVANPPETLVLSIIAKVNGEQKAIDMAQATADSLNKELTSGELLGEQTLGTTTSTISPATAANTTMEQPGTWVAAISGPLLGFLASVSYAMFRHQRDSGHGADRGAETRPGRTAATLGALRQKISDLLRPSQPPAQPQVQARPPYQYQQLPVQSPIPASPETSVIPAPGAMAPQTAPASMPFPASAPMLPGSTPAPVPVSQSTVSSAPAPTFPAPQPPQSPQQTTAAPAIPDSANPAAQPVPSTQGPTHAPAPLSSPASSMPIYSPASQSPVSIIAAPLSSSSAASVSAQPLVQPSAPNPAYSLTSGITSAMQRQQVDLPAPGVSSETISTGTVSSQSASETSAFYRHAPLPLLLPAPADLTVPASPSIAMQPYTVAPTSGNHRFPGTSDGPTRCSTTLPTGQIVSGFSASPTSFTPSAGPSYQYPSAPTSTPAPVTSSAGSPASTTSVIGCRRVPAPASSSAPSTPVRRRITSPLADRSMSSAGWQDVFALPTTTGRRQAQSTSSVPEPPAAVEVSRIAARTQDSASETNSPSPSTPMRQQAPSRRQILTRRRRMSKPRLTLVTPLSEESSIEQTHHPTPMSVSTDGRHRSPDRPDAPPPPPPPSIQPSQQMASVLSASSARHTASTSAASAASASRRRQPTYRSW